MLFVLVLAVTERHNWLSVVGILSAIAFTLIGGISAGAYWASGQTNQMNDVQRRLAAVEGSLSAETANKIIQAREDADQLARQADRLARIEEHIMELKTAASDNRAHLTAIETYLYTGVRSTETKK